VGQQVIGQRFECRPQIVFLEPVVKLDGNIFQVSVGALIPASDRQVRTSRM